MEKKYAFFVALIITFVIAGNWLFFYDFSEFEREKVIITRVIDGDTVELEDGRKIRLLNINTPEKGLPFSNDAANFLKNFEKQSVEMENAGIEKYGRTLGRLYGQENYLNLELVELGFAHAFLVYDSELDDFKKAEQEAMKNELGIWRKSEFYGCLDVKVNKEDELVIIEDDCSINFAGWTLKDESARSYKLDKVKTHNFRVYSAKGKDGDAEFYWGRGSVWNNDKDSIFIRDSQGFLAYYDSYGY